MEFPNGPGAALASSHGYLSAFKSWYHSTPIRVSLVHPVEQVANRLHHGIRAVDVERGVRCVLQHAVFTVRRGPGNVPVDGQLDVIQLPL